MSRQRSPTMKLDSRSIFQTRAASSSSPGCGLRQEQRAASSCGQTPTPSRRRKLLQAPVHFGNLLGRNQPARDVRLIGDQDQRETGFAQFVAGFANARQETQVRRRWRADRACLGGERRDSRRHRDPGTRRGAYIRASPAESRRAWNSEPAQSAWRVSRLHVQPRPRMRSVFKRTTGTSPFQPRSPPVYSKRT